MAMAGFRTPDSVFSAGAGAIDTNFAVVGGGLQSEHWLLILYEGAHAVKDTIGIPSVLLLSEIHMGGACIALALRAL